MKKRWMVILIAVSMLMFWSMAIAGDGKSISQNNFVDAMMLANNSQATPQVNNNALDNLRVEQEEIGQDMLLAAVEAGDNCDLLCTIFSYSCNDTSSPTPLPSYCVDICNACGCNGCP